MTRPAPHREGQPSPLIFHLSAAVTGYQQAMLAALNAGDARFPWHAEMEGYDGPPPLPFDVGVEAAHRLSAMLEGIALWQRHPYRRQAPERPVLWAEGSTRLIDYRPEGGLPVVVVPSLINRAYVLDLMPGRSLLAHLAAQGLRPLLLDWGDPGLAEREMDLEDYRYRRLTPALAVASVLGGGPPAMLGYCMGGTLAAQHVLEGAQVRRLVTIGAPWDFSAARGNAGHARALAQRFGAGQVRQMLRAMTQAFGVIPVGLFQQLFALIDPMQAARKFRRFAAMEQAGEQAAHFVALEDWLADGVPMAGPAAETLLADWQLENRIALRAPRPPHAPAMVVSGRRDSIAPPGVADPLAARLSANVHLRPELGHVGMITGRGAPDAVWTPVVEFLRETG